jgi:hypothetical protein
VLSGRDAIEKLLAEEFTTNPGAKLEIDAEGVRLLSPDVLVEKGVATLASTDGSQGASRYVAVYLKRAGNWKISQLTQTTAPSSSADASSTLQDLAWMVGAWQDGADDTKVKTTVEWTKGQNFLTGRFNVHRAELGNNNRRP